MVNYPNFANLSGNGTVSGFMSLPNSSYPFFWSIIILAVFAITTMSLYFREKSLRTIGNLVSSAGVASLAGIMLVTVGSLFGIFTVTTMVPLIVVFIVLIAIWVFSR